MRTWSVILAAAAGTYLLRASLIVLLRGATVPFVLQRAFRYVAPAVMAAIAVPGIVSPSGEFDPLNLRLPAALVAAVVAWKWGNLLGTLAAGLGIYAVLTMLL